MAKVSRNQIIIYFSSFKMKYITYVMIKLNETLASGFYTVLFIWACYKFP